MGGVIIKRDCDGTTVNISNISSIIRVDGIPICKRVLRDDGVYLQFSDNNKERNIIRGTKFVEVRLDAWINKIT